MIVQKEQTLAKTMKVYVHLIVMDTLSVLMGRMSIIAVSLLTDNDQDASRRFIFSNEHSFNKRWNGNCWFKYTFDNNKYVSGSSSSTNLNVL